MQEHSILMTGITNFELPFDLVLSPEKNLAQKIS